MQIKVRDVLYLVKTGLYNLSNDRGNVILYRFVNYIGFRETRDDFFDKKKEEDISKKKEDVEWERAKKNGDFSANLNVRS